MRPLSSSLPEPAAFDNGKAMRGNGTIGQSIRVPAWT